MRNGCACPQCGWKLGALLVYSAEYAAEHLAKGFEPSNRWPALLVAKALGFCSAICLVEFIAQAMLLGVHVPEVVEVSP